MRDRKKKVKPETIDSAASDEMRIIAKYKARISNPLSAIRAHCIECMGGGVHEVARCTSVDCSLHKLRMGQNAYDKRVMRRMEKEDE